jgi:hypothetical protein
MKTLNTTSSSIFFSRTLNLIFSVRYFSSIELKINVWDIGLTKFQKLILKLLNVQIKEIEKYEPFWRDCYTWKIFIFKQSTETIFLHLDSGNTILCDIKEIFELIEKNGYFFVDQGQVLKEIAPESYFEDLKIQGCRDNIVIAAGNIGFNKDNNQIEKLISISFDLARKGMCLGFSLSEQHRDIEQRFPIRDCKVFRHDQTVLNCSLGLIDLNPQIMPHEIYSSIAKTKFSKVFNHRKRSYSFLTKKITVFKLFLLTYCLVIDSVFIITMILKIKVKK